MGDVHLTQDTPSFEKKKKLPLCPERTQVTVTPELEDPSLHVVVRSN